MTLADKRLKRIEVLRKSIQKGADKKDILLEAMRAWGVAKKTALEYYTIAEL